MMSLACAPEGAADVDADVRATCYPNHRGQEACEAAGWQWYRDYSTTYCGASPGCTPRRQEELPLCGLPCTSDSDCDGTTVPVCGQVGWWGGQDNYGCSGFRVCVPYRVAGYCYQRRAADLCSL